MRGDIKKEPAMPEAGHVLHLADLAPAYLVNGHSIGPVCDPTQQISWAQHAEGSAPSLVLRK